MTITPLSPTGLRFDIADRLTKALRESGRGVSEVAAELRVSRNAVSSWINGRHRPRDRDLEGFAAATGVSVEWLNGWSGSIADAIAGLELSGAEEATALVAALESATGMTFEELGELSRLRESNSRPSHYNRDTFSMAA